jgi:DNA-3-methyladenine glycosylase II
VHRVLAGTNVRIEPAPGGVHVTPNDPALVEHVRRYLGVPFDLDGFTAFAATEPVLARLAVTLRGFRPPLVPDPFESLVTSITAQQISLQAAFSIRNRFIAAFGVAHGNAYAFPTRERVAAATPEELLALGFSRRKAEYVVGLAGADLDLDALAVLPDDEVKAALVSLPGIGEWTAEWFLARHLARSGAWPAGDLGLRKAVSTFYADGRPLSIPEVRAMGERFDPFQNLSAQFLLMGARITG